MGDSVTQQPTESEPPQNDQDDMMSGETLANQMNLLKLLVMLHSDTKYFLKTKNSIEP
jgi:hypothetical protein